MPGHTVGGQSAIGILAVLHGMNAQSIAAFFGEAQSEIANAKAPLAGQTAKSFDAARASLSQTMNRPR